MGIANMRIDGFRCSTFWPKNFDSFAGPFPAKIFQDRYELAWKATLWRAEKRGAPPDSKVLRPIRPSNFRRSAAAF